ncbi:MAG: xanthine dehydrogenase family protein subunit M [Desulfovibrio sp.]
MTIGYASPTNLPQLFEAMATRPEYRLFAGGTDLMVRKGRGLLALGAIINLLTVAEMQGIVESDGALDLGALATHAAIAAHPGVQHTASALAQASSQVGSPQIRNMGTLAGNMCNASPAADTATPLLALDAVVVAAMGRPARERHIPIREFFRGPGKTCLEPGEVVVRVRIPIACSTLGTGSSFIKLARRRSLAIAVINGAAWIALAGGAAPCIAEARIALGAVAPTPIRLPAVEDWLKGQPVTKEVFKEAGRRARACIKPINDIRATADYRRDVAAVLVERLLTQAALDANFCFGNETPVSPGLVSPAEPTGVVTK